jgi:hypothetical protein
MKLFQSLVERFRKRDEPAKRYSYQMSRQGDGASPTEKFTCTHGKTRHNLKVTVLGVECEFSNSPMCSSCTEQYLNRFSTLCASCERPIFPGTPVGQAWSGAPRPFTHLTSECCESGALYCGRWDEGHLITLHELSPAKYPAGTPSVVGHAFNTGDIVIENVD